MKKSNPCSSGTMIQLIVSLLLILNVNLYGYHAITNKADHRQLDIVPAPGEVVIDGKLGDWDLSGSALMYISDATKEEYSVNLSMMYDKAYLYIGGRIKDPTPMTNTYSSKGKANMAWNADAIQLRFISDPEINSKASLQTGGHMSAKDQTFLNHITLWYPSREEKACYQCCYTLKFRDQQVNPAGVDGFYLRDKDGKGCTFEYRIP